MRLQTKVWFTRVPTSSNVADKPSRLDGSELDSKGVLKDSLDWNLGSAKLEAEGSDEWGFEYGIP